MLEKQLTRIAARVITSRSWRDLRRHYAESRRWLCGAAHELHYFHRVDDPYCQLMLAALPAFAERFGVRLVPHVVASLDPDMYPHPELLRDYALTDAARLARLYGIDYLPFAGCPDRAAANTAALQLAGIAAGGDAAAFCAQAHSAHAGLVAGTTPAASEGATNARQRLVADTALLARWGHYLPATVYYGGEWYWGLDRLDHLEERLIGLGLERTGDETLHFDRTWRDIMTPARGAAEHGSLELFVSLRSPYSYIANFQAQQFAQAHRLTLEVKPVLPMVMRGMAVPRAKRIYILTDAAREADKAGLPFGNVTDPLGAGIERAYALAWYAAQRGDLAKWLDAAFRSVAVEAIDLASDRGLGRAAARAGIPWRQAREALADERWRDWVAGHRDELAAEGMWGVPCLRYRGVTAWGQDRFWVIKHAIEKLSA